MTESYIPTTLKKDIDIGQIVTVHYFEYSRDYAFSGESHAFWEFLYVDKGEVNVRAGEKDIGLCQGDIIFHKPDEFHTVYANGAAAPNLIVVAFTCDSPSMRYFDNQIVRADEAERMLLARIVREARDAFSSPLDNPRTKKMERAASGAFGCEQMIGLLLEQLLIHIVRRGMGEAPSARVPSSVKVHTDNELAKRVMTYMEDHLGDNLSFSQICRHAAQSATNLKTIYKSVTGFGVMEHYRTLKIEAAKTMLREGNGNITQIADRLGYTSVHYFSRYFKQATGMTPSEYTRSILAINQ